MTSVEFISYNLLYKICKKSKCKLIICLALTDATDLCSQGATVGILGRYPFPGGSAGQFSRDGVRFDVSASMLFGLGSDGTTNFLTRALDVDNKSSNQSRIRFKYIIIYRKNRM